MAQSFLREPSLVAHLADVDAELLLRLHGAHALLVGPKALEPKAQVLLSLIRPISQVCEPVPPTYLMPGIQALALSEELHEMGSVGGVAASVTIDQQGSALAVSVTAEDIRGWSALVARDGEVSRDRT